MIPNHKHYLVIVPEGMEFLFEMYQVGKNVWLPNDIDKSIAEKLIQKNHPDFKLTDATS